jgi:hypothetical protein
VRGLILASLVRQFTLGYPAVVMSENPRALSPFQRVAIVVGLVVLLFALGDLNRRMENARTMERDAQAVATQVAGLEGQSNALETRIAGATSESVVETWAHGEGRLVRDGERLVVPVPPPGAPTPAPPTPTPFPQPPSPWLVWRELLFGN